LRAPALSRRSPARGAYRTRCPPRMDSVPPTILPMSGGLGTFPLRSPTAMQAARTSHLLGALDGLEIYRVFGDSTKMLREDAGQGTPDLCRRRTPQASASCARTCRPSLRSSPRRLDGRVARLRRQHEDAAGDAGPGVRLVQEEAHHRHLSICSTMPLIATESSGAT
jgi:hypothetical protein